MLTLKIPPAGEQRFLFPTFIFFYFTFFSPLAQKSYPQKGKTKTALNFFGGAI